MGTDNARVRNKSDQRILKKHRAHPVRHVPHPGRMPRAIHHRPGTAQPNRRHRREGETPPAPPRRSRRTRPEPVEPGPDANLTTWIRDHPELVREVREQSSTREGRRRRSEDQYAYRQRKTMRPE